MDKIELFTDVFFKSNFKKEIDLDLVKKELYDYKENYDPLGRNRSNSGGYQSSDFKYEIIQKKYKNISNVLNLISQKMNDITNRKNLGISNSWFNINKNQAYNVEHKHPGSAFSGTFYVAAEDDQNIDNGSIYFLRERVYDDYLFPLLLKNTKNDTFNSSKYTFKPKSGDLIIFPSYLIHGVNSTNSEIDRISLAFNSFFPLEG